MWLKLLGSSLVVLGFGSVGLMIAGNYRQRVAELKELRATLRLLEAEIVYAASLLPEAFLKLSRKTSPPLSLLFAAAREALLSGQGLTAEEAWQLAVEEFSQETALSASDLEVLLNFGRGLGNSDREEQVKNFRLFQEELEVQEREAEEEGKRGARTWRFLGFLTGAALVLLLL